MKNNESKRKKSVQPKEITGNEMLSIEMTVEQADLIMKVFTQAPLQLSYNDTKRVVQTIGNQAREQISKMQKGEGDE